MVRGSDEKEYDVNTDPNVLTQVRSYRPGGVERHTRKLRIVDTQGVFDDMYAE